MESRQRAGTGKRGVGRCPAGWAFQAALQACCQSLTPLMNCIRNNPRNLYGGSGDCYATEQGRGERCSAARAQAFPIGMQGLGGSPWHPKRSLFALARSRAGKGRGRGRGEEQLTLLVSEKTEVFSSLEPFLISLFVYSAQPFLLALAFGFVKGKTSAAHPLQIRTQVLCRGRVP